MNTHTELLVYLAGLTRCQSYLEIGVAEGSNFLAVPSPKKVGVDPQATGRVEHVRKCTSDEFFERWADKDGPFDLAFVDGDHRGPQVLKDVEGALEHLNPDNPWAAIVCHDSNPENASQSKPEPHSAGAWCGTVWQAIARLRATGSPPFVMTLDADYGCAVILPGVEVGGKLPDGLVPREVRPGQPFAGADFFSLPYEWFAEHRQTVLNLASPEEFVRRLGRL